MDPRWNNRYPFFNEHIELNLRGDWDTFFYLLSLRLERFVLYGESGISNPAYLGDCLVTESLGHFTFDRTTQLHLALKSFFSGVRVNHEIEERLDYDQQVQAAVASLKKLQKQKMEKYVGADALSRLHAERKTTNEELVAKNAITQAKKQCTPICRATIYKVKLSVLQALFKFMLKLPSGQNAFQALRMDVQTFFVNAGISYDIDSDGEIIRYGQEPLSAVLVDSIFRTDDSELDGLLQSARQKFLDRDSKIHRESIEKLWDAWERLKTIEEGKDKLAQASALFSRLSVGTKFREIIEKEGRELTTLGNNFMIRHTETNKIPISAEVEVDYLFHRLFSLIWLLLRETGRIS